MSFEVYTNTQTESKSNNKATVDFDKLNSYVVEAADLQEAAVLPGVISCIVDLGIQAQSDAEYVFEGTEEDEVVEQQANPAVKFETRAKFFDNGKWLNDVRVKIVPQRDVQSVALAVDFPDILVDKGQFFGESKPLPLRIWMGGQFFIEGSGMVIQNLMALRETNLDTTRATQKWSLNPKGTLYKMAKSAKLVKDGEVFKANQIDQLLGTAHQFEARVFMKPAKNGKSYYTEQVKFVGALSRGQTVDDSVVTPMLIQFNKENPEAAIKELRAHVVNTIKRAKNYEGSVIQKQIEEVRGSYSSEAKTEQKQEQDASKQEVVKPKAKKQPEPVFDNLDDDIPFMNPYFGVRSLLV
jgi:hypothetical protein